MPWAHAPADDQSWRVVNRYFDLVRRMTCT